MKKVMKAWSLSLTVLMYCGELLQAAPYPAEVPSNPVYYKRLHRNRAYQDRDMDVYEVRELYYVQHTTPKLKVRPLTDVEVDQLIRCDFEPMLPECTKLISTPSISRSSTTTTTTEATSTIPTTTTIGTTSTDFPLLATLPTLPTLPQDSSDSHEVTERTTTSPEDEDEVVPIDPNDGSDELGESDGQTLEDEAAEEEDNSNQGGSIGGNDYSAD